MQYIEAPNEVQIQSNSVFLAGGISNCPDWQSEIMEAFKKEKITLLNPRRVDFPMNETSAAQAQIEWEFRHLNLADAILFWFPKETLCPITLFELGAQSRNQKPLFVGIHPDYQRRQDVEIQLQLARPDIEIVYDLKMLIKQVKIGLYKS